MVDAKLARKPVERRTAAHRPSLEAASVAGGVGFEPTYGSPRKRFSRPPPSSARPPSRFPIYPGCPLDQDAPPPRLTKAEVRLYIR